MSEPVNPPQGAGGRALGGAPRVAAGILASRLTGLARDLLVAHLFGVGRHADVFRAAFRGPNILQNLLGEQSLSAAFIPIYSRLLAEGREKEAGRFAGAIFGLLLATAGSIALIGVFLAEPIVVLLSPGYLGDAARVAAGEAEVDRLPLAVAAVRILFPMTALLVLSAWALAVLNSHRRFFVSYFAPVLWNTAILAALIAAGSAMIEGGLGGAAASGPDERNGLLLAACWGALVGGGLQFAFQLPVVTRVLTGFRLSLSRRVVGVKQALGRFTPLLFARGAAQLSGYLDLVLASLLAAGAQGGIGHAQTLYLLPIALFSMSVAAAELPELSALTGAGVDREAAQRAEKALRSIAFWIVPTAAGYLVIGYPLVGALFRRGRFDEGANWLVWAILAAYSLGLLATGWSRLLGNVFFAAGDTRRPATVAVLRVVVSAALGAFLMFQLDGVRVARMSSEPTELRFGAVGLALGAAVAAWIELVLLMRALRRRGSPLRLPLLYAGRRAVAAAAALVPALAVWQLLGSLPRVAFGGALLVGYAASYMGLAWMAGVPEARTAARWVFGDGRRGGRR